MQTEPGSLQLTTENQQKFGASRTGQMGARRSGQLGAARSGQLVLHRHALIR